MDKQVQHHIREFPGQRLAETKDPRQLGAPTSGAHYHDLWPYRVGDYRIIAKINDREILFLIVQTAHHREAYRS